MTLFDPHNSLPGDRHFLLHSKDRGNRPREAVTNPHHVASRHNGQALHSAFLGLVGGCGDQSEDPGSRPPVPMATSVPESPCPTVSPTLISPVAPRDKQGLRSGLLVPLVTLKNIQATALTGTQMDGKEAHGPGHN